MKNNSGKTNRVVVFVLMIMVIFNLFLLAWIGWPVYKSGWKNFSIPFLNQISNTPVAAGAVIATRAIPTDTIDSSPTLSPSPLPTIPVSIPTQEGMRLQGIIILSMTDGYYAHLFAYNPQYLPFTRLTNSTWDDITPTISPNGTRLVYSSHKNGYWNLYMMDLATGTTTQITDSPDYKSDPTWSPDNQWLAYDNYVDGNLDIYIRSMVDPTQPVIRLTDDPEPDFSPSWSPKGRTLAFVSTRSGEEEIWLARLDQTDDRFINISRSPETANEHPDWSPDGRYLAWSANQNGFHTIMVWDSQNPDLPARQVGSGSWPVWSPYGDTILTEMSDANEITLGGFHPANGTLIFPPTSLYGALHGMVWKAGPVPDLVAGLSLPANATAPAPQIWKPVLSVNPTPPGGRFGVVPLNDVSAPFPYLHDAVNESFQAMREQVAKEVGWDMLSSLENAYVALTQPPTPNMEEDWLLTGRGIALNPLPLYAGWMAIVREDYDGQTYWRLYLKARFQDGSQGIPLTKNPWNLSARYAGNPASYEKGGALAPVPSGYWVDFTEIALRYGWERLPSQVDWRTFFPGIRFNQYVLRDGLDWNTAMSEIYPPELLKLPTLVPTSTPTITETPENYQEQSPSPTPTETMTPTLHATWTPVSP
ncbi:MAG: DPP IV N-terminal domain-containing protein [Anaerolineaceae bacterium]|jgi:TolB protein